MVEKLFLVWNAEMSLAGGLAYVASRLRGTEGRADVDDCDGDLGRFAERLRAAIDHVPS